MPFKIGDGDEQVERMAVRQQHRPALAGRHRVEGVEDQRRENLPAKGRFEPAGADEAGQFHPHFLARVRRDRALHRIAGPPRRHPDQRRRPEFCERAGRAGVGIEQAVDIGIVEPQVGQRLQRLAGLDRLRQKDAIDAAGAGPGDNVRQHAQPHPAGFLHIGKQLVIDGLAACLRLHAVMIGAAGARQPPYLLGDAMHVNGQADAAIADQPKPEFPLLHGVNVAERRQLVEGLSGAEIGPDR